MKLCPSQLLGTLSTFLIMNAYACEAPSAEQDQEQTVAITPDQLGSLEGSITLQFPSSGTILTLPEAISRHLINPELGGLSLELRLYGSSGKKLDKNLLDACTKDPRCATEASTDIPTNGKFFFSGLLVGNYRLEINLECVDDDWYYEKCTSACAWNNCPYLNPYLNSDVFVGPGTTWDVIIGMKLECFWTLSANKVELCREKETQ